MSFVSFAYLPGAARHWRRIATPQDERWADLNAPGTLKFSDADFPPFLGWQCINDDPAPDDQRCDSTALRTPLARSIPDMEARAHALEKTSEGYRALARQTENPKARPRLHRLICNFPSEFDFNTFDARYAHVQKEEDFKDNPDNWKRFRDHAEALCPDDLPKAYLDARWHVHPTVFIEHMRKCPWLSEGEMKRIVPRRALRGIGAGVPNNIVYENTQNNANLLTRTHRIEANRMWRKYGVTTRERLAAFLGNAVQETGWWRVAAEERADGWWYAPWFGRGLLQLTHPENYIGYWRFLGNIVDTAVERTLLQAKAQASQQRNNTPLHKAETHISAQMRSWRDEVSGPLPFHACNSAGYYWTASGANREADARAVNTHRTITLAANSQQRAGQIFTFYENAAFRRVACLINLPGHINRSNPALNGLVDRYHAFTYAQALLSDEAIFPDAQGIMQWLPDYYETKELP